MLRNFSSIVALSLAIICLVCPDVQAKTIQLACSELSMSTQSSAGGVSNLLLPTNTEGIFMPEAFDLEVDLDHKTASGGVRGSFKVDPSSGIILVLTSTDSNAARRKSLGIDRRTGVFIEKDESLELRNGKTKVVSTDWETGVCSTKTNRF